MKNDEWKDVAGVNGVIGSLELEPATEPDAPDSLLRASQSEDAVVRAYDAVVGLVGIGSPCMIASHFCTAEALLPGMRTRPVSVCGRSSHSCTSVTMSNAVITR